MQIVRAHLVVCFAGVVTCAGLLLGCGSGGTGGDDKAPSEVFLCAATDGSPGGRGGSVSVFYNQTEETTPVGTWEKLIDVRGGEGGVAGESVRGGASRAGPPGSDGEMLVLPVASKELGDFQEAPSIVVGPESDLVMAAGPVPGGTVRVREFRIQAGVVLEIACDMRIVAETFVVEEGATLRVWRREGTACEVMLSGSNLPDRGGLDGGGLSVIAKSLDVSGTIDVSGNNGQDRAGGDGGTLSLTGNNVVLGENAILRARGGDGGRGRDEHKCEN